jgi:hypothetical protein
MALKIMIYYNWEKSLSYTMLNLINRFNFKMVDRCQINSWFSKIKIVVEFKGMARIPQFRAFKINLCLVQLANLCSNVCRLWWLRTPKLLLRWEISVIKWWWIIWTLNFNLKFKEEYKNSNVSGEKSLCKSSKSSSLIQD